MKIQFEIRFANNDGQDERHDAFTVEIAKIALGNGVVVAE